MPMTQRDAQALTYLVGRLREETKGATKWDEHGVYAVVSKLIGQHLATSIERITRHAADIDAKTPGAINRPFVPEARVPDNRWKPPKKHEECPKHPGQWPSACGPCATEDVEAFYDEPATESVLPAGLTGVAAVRAVLATVVPPGQASA